MESAQCPPAIRLRHRNVTLNLRQAARVSDFTAYRYLGEMIEFGVTDEGFIKPKRK